MNAPLSAVLIIAVAALAGCAAPPSAQHREGGAYTAPGGGPVYEVTTPGELPTVPEYFRMRFPQLRPEMPVAEFKALFPEAYFVERKHASGGETIDAYEVCLRLRYRFLNDPQVYLQSGKVWFYFAGQGLETWGEPQVWPVLPGVQH